MYPHEVGMHGSEHVIAYASWLLASQNETIMSHARNS